jgi:hypothetical protein
MQLTLNKANQELALAAKEENNKVIEAMYDDLVILPNLMADPRFYGPDPIDCDPGWSWERNGDFNG